MSRRIVFSLVVLCCAAMVRLSRADDVLYTSRGAFQSDLGLTKNYTFEPAQGFAMAPADISSLDQDQVQTSTNFGNPGPASLQNYPGKSGGSLNQVLSGQTSDGTPFRAPLTMSFATPRLGVAFDDMALDSPPLIAAIVNVTHADGSF